MVMETIDQHLIIQFSDMMHRKAQQSQSYLRPYVKILQMSGDKWAYDGLGSVEARKLNGRINQTVFDDIDHNRREIAKERFVVTLPIDGYDVRSKLLDPQGMYAEECVNAMERQFDATGYVAMFASVRTGRDFETTVTATADGVAEIDATGTGLTLGKWLEVNEGFTDDELKKGRRVAGISGGEQTTSLQISQLTSGDFSRQYALENGELVKICGIDIITFGANSTRPILNVNGSGHRECFVMYENGLVYGMSKEWSITIKDRPDLVDVKQVQITAEFGAVRTEGKRIKKLKVVA